MIDYLKTQAAVGKTVKHAIHGTMVRAMPARDHKPGKWCCVACSVCGMACFCDLDDAMKSAQAHPECLKHA